MASVEPRYCYRHPDRETGLSCSECGRPICYECMTPAAVGIRCPEHSGQAHGIQRVRRTAQRATYEGSGAVVTKILIGLNVAIFLIELAIGGTSSGTHNWIYEKGALIASGLAHNGDFYNGPVALAPASWVVGVAHGDWWRLITAAFLHYGPIHLGMNMLALWWFGAPIEQYLGRARYLLVYVVSGLAGSAGALLLTPNNPTAGASGAIFGILGAALVLERQGSMVFGGQALAIIALNLVFTFAFGLGGVISIGGHIGGLIGGALCMLAMSRFGRGHAAYGRPGVVGIAGVIGVGVLSVVVAYLAV